MSPTDKGVSVLDRMAQSQMAKKVAAQPARALTQLPAEAPLQIRPLPAGGQIQTVPVEEATRMENFTTLAIPAWFREIRRAIQDIEDASVRLKNGLATAERSLGLDKLGEDPDFTLMLGPKDNVDVEIREIPVQPYVKAPAPKTEIEKLERAIEMFKIGTQLSDVPQIKKVRGKDVQLSPDEKMTIMTERLAQLQAAVAPLHEAVAAEMTEVPTSIRLNPKAQAMAAAIQEATAAVVEPESLAARMERLAAEAQEQTFTHAKQETPAEAVAPPVPAAVIGWTCPTHGQAIEKTSPKGRRYGACPVAGCTEFERR
jgi:hypothetical protein